MKIFFWPKLALLLASLVIFLGLSLVMTWPVHAAGSFYITPGSKTLTSGQTATFSVRVNTGGEAVNAVQANLNYPLESLDFQSISASSSAFSIEAQSSGGGGSVVISRGVIGAGVSGDVLVATVTFKAKTNSGSAAISFGADSAIVRGSDQANILSGKSGANVTFVAPTPKPSTTPTPPATPTPTPDTSAPTITAVAVKDIGFTSATVTWKTNEPSSSTVEYGLNDSYGVSSLGPDNLTDHTVALSSAIIVPGVTYHYRVRSFDAAKNESISPDATFIAKGYPVVVKITDSAGKPLAGAKVTFLVGTSWSVTTDKDGFITLSSLPAGDIAMMINSNGNVQAATLTVKEGTDEQLKAGHLASQNIGVTVASANRTQNSWVIIGISLAVILLLGVAGWLLKRKFFNRGGGSQDPPRLESISDLVESDKSSPAATSEDITPVTPNLKTINSQSAGSIIEPYDVPQPMSPEMLNKLGSVPTTMSIKNETILPSLPESNSINPSNDSPASQPMQNPS